jgi:RNA polymerase sigma-70 factor, ECF subfamily
MSLLPSAFRIPPLAWGESPASHRKKPAVQMANHRSGPHRELRASGGCLGTDFASVYRTYRRRVYSQCLRMLHNHHDAEDAAQTVFLQLFRKAHTFRGDSSFSTWLYRLTTNCVLMEIRKMRRRGSEVTSWGAPLGTDVVDTVLDKQLDAFRGPSTLIFDRLNLSAAISQLPAGYQEIFKLHDVEGYTHGEVAALMGIKIGTSKSQLHKARLRMRLLLQTGGGWSRNRYFRKRDVTGG